MARRKHSRSRSHATAASASVPSNPGANGGFSLLGLDDSDLSELRSSGVRIPDLDSVNQAYETGSGPFQSSTGFNLTRGYGGQSNYAANQVSDSRGWLVWNTLDTRKETTRWDRMSLIADSRALVANSGLARVIGTLARMVGSQRPQATSSSTAWNKVAEDGFNFLAKSNLLSDTRRLYSFYRAQPLFEFLCLRDGEVFIILTESAGKRARFAIYEAHRCYGCPPGEEDPKFRWFDGIQLNAEGAAINYWFVDPDDNSKGTKLSAYNVIHYANRDGISPHGLPALTHAIIDLKDVVETRGFTKAGIKIAGLFGVSIESDATAQGPQRPTLSNLRNGQTPFAQTQGSNLPGQPAPASPATPSSNIPKYEEVFSQNGGNSVLGLDPGKKIAVVKDERPGPNQQAFEMNLLATIAIGLKVPPQMIYFIEKQTGPMTRLTISHMKGWIEDKQSNQQSYILDRFYSYAVAKDDKAGYLSGTPILDEETGEPIRLTSGEVSTVTRPNDWWCVQWQRPSSIASIDPGRDAATELKKYFAGLATLSSITEPEGIWWEDHVHQKEVEADYIITAAKRLAKKHDVPFDFAFALLRENPAGGNVITLESPPPPSN